MLKTYEVELVKPLTNIEFPPLCRVVLVDQSAELGLVSVTVILELSSKACTFERLIIQVVSDPPVVQVEPVSITGLVLNSSVWLKIVGVIIIKKTAPSPKVITVIIVFPIM